MYIWNNLNEKNKNFLNLIFLLRSMPLLLLSPFSMSDNLVGGGGGNNSTSSNQTNNIGTSWRSGGGSGGGTTAGSAATLMSSTAAGVASVESTSAMQKRGAERLFQYMEADGSDPEDYSR